MEVINRVVNKVVIEGKGILLHSPRGVAIVAGSLLPELLLHFLFILAVH